MQCNDTGSQKAVRLEHLDIDTGEHLNKIIGMIKQLFHGNGRITLTLSGGNVSEFETSMKTPNRRKKLA
jgi:hypothetical protein